MGQVDLFTTVHKAIRALIYDLGMMLQTTDFTDERGRNACLAALEHFLEMLHEHAGYEDRTVFAATRRFEPEIIGKLEEEHGEIDGHLEQVHKSIARVRAAATDQERIEAGAELNRSASKFVAFYLGHLIHEEETVLPATLKYFNDGELSGMREEVQRATTPARFAEWMRWMFPSININELVGIFRGLKAHAPAPFYQAMSQMAHSSLGELRWRDLEIRAGLTESDTLTQKA
ncbi:MAG TPA: hemerythrin domain-containing protein [Bryobacteraceae bacterium]